MSTYCATAMDVTSPWRAFARTLCNVDSSRKLSKSLLLDNANLTFNPATGAPYPFATRALRAYPDWGVVGEQMFTGWSNYHGLQSVLTKRFSHRWQGAMTYTLSALRDGEPAPLSGIKQAWL